MFQFTGKTVFIISPERWGIMKVSKHHYALELTKAGATVYFIEPPGLNYKRVQIKQSKEDSHLFIVQYKPVFRGRRFLPDVIYRMLLKKQVKLLLKKIQQKPDVVFCFQGYLFRDLSWFGAPSNIFFAADLFNYEQLPPEINSAELLLAVSDTIQKRLEASGRKVILIGHGLQEPFVRMAIKKIEENKQGFPASTKITVGYVGNLRMEAMNRGMMMNIIQHYPQINFIFWGSYKKEELNLGGLNNPDTDQFIQFLETSANVQLKGVARGETLLEQMQECDFFWICWKKNVNRLWDGSNSHKILEYLATGRPVVAHYVSTYSNTDLLNMSAADENEQTYYQYFSDTVALIQTGEPVEKIQKRLQFVVDHGYDLQLQKIASYLS